MPLISSPHPSVTYTEVVFVRLEQHAVNHPSHTVQNSPLSGLRYMNSRVRDHGPFGEMSGEKDPDLKDRHPGLWIVTNRVWYFPETPISRLFQPEVHRLKRLALLQTFRI